MEDQTRDTMPDTGMTDTTSSDLGDALGTNNMIDTDGTSSTPNVDENAGQGIGGSTDKNE